MGTAHHKFQAGKMEISASQPASMKPRAHLFDKTGTYQTNRRTLNFCALSEKVWVLDFRLPTPVFHLCISPLKVLDSVTLDSLPGN